MMPMAATRSDTAEHGLHHTGELFGLFKPLHIGIGLVAEGRYFFLHLGDMGHVVHKDIGL